MTAQRSAQRQRDMPLMKNSKAAKGERKDDTLKASKGGKYTRVGPVAPHVKGSYHFKFFISQSNPHLATSIQFIML